MSTQSNHQLPTESASAAPGRKTLSGIGLAAATAVLGGLVSTAVAQDTVLEEVVVTAQFREQNLQQTPVAITAVTSDTLEARSQVSIVDVANQAPNVTLKAASAPFGPSLQAFIRGVGQADFSYALEPGVGVYVDDVYYSTLVGSIFDLIDLDRVEILRGPQGTLSGQNSIGGSIKLFSRKPDGEGGGYVQAIYGDFDRVDIRAAGEFTLVEDELFGRIAGVSHTKDGYVTRYDFACTHPGSGVTSSQIVSDNCELGTEGGKSYTGMRTSFRWMPTDVFEANLVMDYTNDDSEASPFTLLYVGGITAGVNTPGVVPSPGIPGPPIFQAGPPGGLPTNTTIDGVPLGTATGSAFIPYSPIFPGYAQDTFTDDPYVNYSTYCNPRPVDGTTPYCIPADNQVDSWGGSLTMDFEINDFLSLKSITASRRYEGQWSIDEDGSPIGNTTIRNRVGHQSVSQELRLSGSFDFLDFTVGAFYFDQENHYGGRIDLLTLAFIEDDDVESDTKAIFANTDWHITDAFSVVLAARYTEVSKSFTYGRLGVPGNTYVGGVSPAVGPLNGTVGEYEGDRWDYRLVGQFQVTDDVMVYGQVATGFKSGGINPRPFSAVQALPHDPETLDAIEFGIKSDIGDAIRLNAAIFLNKYEDILMTVNQCIQPGGSIGGPCAMPVNAGEADVSGVELEVQYFPTDALSIDASASYLDFEYTSILPLAQTSGIALDMRAPFTPELQYSLGIQYEFSGNYGSITPRVDYNYKDSFFTSAINAPPYNEVEDYSLVNARLSWLSPDEAWNIALQITNLTDELYYTGIFDNRSSSRTVHGVPGAPREWAVSVKRSF